MLKKLLLGGAICLVLLLVALVTIDSRLYASYIEQKVVALAGSRYVNLTFKDSDFKRFTFTAGEADVLFVRYLTSLHLEQLAIRPGLAGFLPPRGGLSFSGRAYSGDISGKVGGSMGGGTQLLDLHIAGLNLAEHPQILGLGIQAGTLALDVQGLRLPELDGSIDLSLEGVEKPGSQPLPVQNPWLQMFPIPQLQKLSLKGRIVCSAGECQVPELVEVCSFLEMRARGSFTVKLPNAIEKIDAEAEFKLSPEASTQVGPFLPVMSSNRVDSTTKRFKVRVTGSSLAPVFEFSKL